MAMPLSSSKTPAPSPLTTSISPIQASSPHPSSALPLTALSSQTSSIQHSKISPPLSPSQVMASQLLLAQVQPNGNSPSITLSPNTSLLVNPSPPPTASHSPTTPVLLPPAAAMSSMPQPKTLSSPSPVRTTNHQWWPVKWQQLMKRMACKPSAALEPSALTIKTPATRSASAPPTATTSNGSMATAKRQEICRRSRSMPSPTTASMQGRITKRSQVQSPGTTAPTLIWTS